MTDLVTLQARLLAAENAYHDYMITGSAQSISESGRSVTYTTANISELRRYINQLKDEISLMNGETNNRPLYL